MEWVLDHSPKAKSYVGTLSADRQLQDIKTLKDDDDKEGWVEKLSEADTVYTIFGAADLMALRAYSQQARVFRAATRLVSQLQRQLPAATESNGQGKLITLAHLAANAPDKFYEFRPLDSSIARVRAQARAFYVIQEKLRKPAELRLQAAYREAYLTDPLRAELTQDQYVKRMLTESPVFDAFTKEEETWEEKLTESLRGIPVWDKVLKGTQARGIGALLGGVLIGEIGDIRRFPHRDNLVAYCGYHPMAAREYMKPAGVTHEYAQRQSGFAAMWNQKMRQATWKWSAVQLPKMAVQTRFVGDHWVQMYLERKKFEHQHIRETLGIKEPIPVKTPKGNTQFVWGDLHLHKRACRWVGARFLRWLHKEWWALVASGDM